MARNKTSYFSPLGLLWSFLCICLHIYLFFSSWYYLHYHNSNISHANKKNETNQKTLWLPCCDCPLSAGENSSHLVGIAKPSVWPLSVCWGSIVFRVLLPTEWTPWLKWFHDLYWPHTNPDFCCGPLCLDSMSINSSTHSSCSHVEQPRDS